MFLAAKPASPEKLVIPDSAFALLSKDARQQVVHALEDSGTRARLTRGGLSVFMRAEETPAHGSIADFRVQSADAEVEAEIWYFDDHDAFAAALSELTREDKSAAADHFSRTTQNGSFLVRVKADGIYQSRGRAALSAIAGGE